MLQCQVHRKGLAQDPNISVIRNGLIHLCTPGQSQCSQPRCFLAGSSSPVPTPLSSSPQRPLSTDWTYHQHSFHGLALCPLKMVFLGRTCPFGLVGCSMTCFVLWGPAFWLLTRLLRGGSRANLALLLCVAPLPSTGCGHGKPNLPCPQHAIIALIFG